MISEKRLLNFAKAEAMRLWDRENELAKQGNRIAIRLEKELYQNISDINKLIKASPELIDTLKSVMSIGNYSTQGHDMECKCALCEILRIVEKSIKDIN